MKDAYEVLYEKEGDLARVRKEIESLTLTAQLLADDHLIYFEPNGPPAAQDKKPAQKATAPEATETEGKPYVWPRMGLWGNLKIRR
jgi:hypothetical protein